MDIIHFFIHNLGTLFEQFIHHFADHFFIAGNGGCGDNHIIIGADFHAPMFGKRHTVQRRHRLALTARGNHNHFFGGITVDAVNTDQNPLRHTNIAEFRRNRHDIFKTSARKRNLAT